MIEYGCDNDPDRPVRPLDSLPDARLDAAVAMLRALQGDVREWASLSRPARRGAILDLHHLGLCDVTIFDNTPSVYPRRSRPGETAED